MKRNAVIPYAIIAIVGIVMVIVISIAGVNQREAIQKSADGSEKVEEKKSGETSDSPEDIYASSCASCHGEDLSGGMGPDLREVGGRLSKEEIHDIVMNGKGQMPAGIIKEEAQSDAIAGWLAEEHK